MNYLVHNILLGNGVLASNIAYTGDDTAFGFFNGVLSNIGLDSGIILTNGRAEDACGPNNRTDTSFSWPRCHQYHDADLTLISGVTMTSVATIQFDFIPYSDTVKFQYVFGSEEYPEFVGAYDDAFGFFVSGPGISGPFSNNAENIAVLPNSTTAVTINTVNCSTNSAYYVCNDASSVPCNVGCPTQAQMLLPTTVQYDGFTVPLTAVAAVQCGQQYHIKIAIGNAIDCKLESGVFLKSGSFASSGAAASTGVTFNNTFYPGDTVLYRGNCGNASVFIERGAANNSDTIVIDTAGTATPGVDYSPLPDTVILPIGVLGDTLHISAFPSAKTGLQTVIMHLIQRQCSQPDTQTLTIYIGNPPPIIISEPTAVACYNGNAALTPSVSGGIGLGGYLYKWSNGSTASSDTIHNVVRDTSFVVHVKDQCGDSASDTLHAITDLSIKLSINNDTTLICPNDTILLIATVIDGTPGYSYSWSNSGTTSAVKVFPSATTKYKVTVTDTCGSMAKDSTTITIVNNPLVISSRDTTINCGGIVNLSVHASGDGDYTYSWSNGGSTSSISPTVTKDTSYIVTVGTPCGSQFKKDTIKVTVLPPSFHVTLSGTTTICNGQTTVLSASGGNTYLWSTNATTTSIPVSPTSNQTYSVAVSVGNCVIDTSIAVTVDPTIVVTLTSNQSICQGDSTTLVATGGGTYKWSSGQTTSSIRVAPLVPVTYTVVVSKGCVDSASTGVFVKPVLVTVCCDTTIMEGSSVKLVSSLATSYKWMPSTGLSCTDCPTPIANPTVTTTYTLSALDTNGCPAVRTITVTIESPCADFKVPTVFTPNNDGINDDFIINVLNASAYNITIYDRWGKQVFTSSNIANYWNGRINGTDNLVPNGTYYYVITASCDNIEYNKKGFVEVLGEK